MKLILKKGSIKNAPKDFVRVVLTQEKSGVKRFVQEGKIRSLHFGAGKDEMNIREFIIFCRSIVRTAKANKIKNIVLQLDELLKLVKPRDTEHLAQLAAENFEMANYEYNTFKTRPKEGWDIVERVYLYGKFSLSIERYLKKGQEIGRAVNECRALANTPGGDMTPTMLAASARATTRGLRIKVSVLGEKEMRKLGMGALLAVAKGSIEKPTLTVLEYRGGKGKPIVLAGKGVTFDSGGLNLKPSNGIYEMHMDMSGAAAALYAVVLAARLKLKKRIVALLPSVENMPGNSAYRPGDVLTSLSGKTIEVIDTDAEGRLILADALTYAKRFKPSVVIDIATLTGAAISALGLYASALLSRDDELVKRLCEDAEASGDYVWRLPLWDEYEERVKGEFADLKNVPGGATSRYGGAIDGGMFLWQFAKELECPWAHLDIAPRMTAAPGEELAKGAAGAPLRLLVRFIEQWKL